MAVRDWMPGRKVSTLWVLVEDGFEVVRPENPLNPIRQLLDQLAADGRAVPAEQSSLIGWDEAIALWADEDLRDAPVILALPPLANLAPELESTGTPTDPQFRIEIVGWHREGRRYRCSDIERLGACVRIDGDNFLLPAAAWNLVRSLEALADAATESSPADRFLAAGRIAALAAASGATTDDYLARTRFVTSDRLDVRLAVAEALGVQVVEITPLPDGAPEGLVTQFDRFQSVQPRYDVVQPDGGIAHVALSEQVQDALRPIKRSPGRRLVGAQAEAFLRNPYGFLGENSDGVLPPERWDAAVNRAHALAWILEAVVSPSEHSLRLVSQTGERDVVVEAPTDGDLRALLRAASEADRRSSPVFTWQRNRIELTPRTREALTEVQHWLAIAQAESLGLTLAQVFDLSAYSDRVAGFDGKAITVPIVKKDGAAREWVEGVPEQGAGLIHVDPNTGESTHVPLGPNDLRAIREAVATARREGKAGVRIPGRTDEVPVGEVESWVKAWEHQGERGLPPIKKPKLPTMPSLRIFQNIDAKEYGDSIIPPLEPGRAAELPAMLRADVRLKDHQERGIALMQQRFLERSVGVRGMLLADDMGLGKTLQALAFIGWYRETTPSARPCLVVAPVSLLENWRSEIRKFLDLPDNVVATLYGKGLSTYRLGRDEVDLDLAAMGLKKFLRPGFAEGSAIVLTTYETLRDFEFSLGREHWGVLVCDEAQKIKTPGAQVTRAAKAMKADFRIACTGTPVENTLADYWCLFDFFQPGLLGSLSEFTREFRRSIELREEGHEEQVEILRKATMPWVLRRMKSDVAELPPKIDAEHPEGNLVLAELPMSALQRSMYLEAVQGLRKLLDKEAADREPGAILGVLHHLRQICAHPLAVRDPASASRPISDHIAANPKLAWTLYCLGRIKDRQEKVILFTEFREIQRLLQRAVAEQFGIPVDIVNGDTSVVPELEASRQRLIDAFQARPGFAVIILSTTAVGFGVNVQAANHVIHFTRPWNPAKEDQATDRAYRIGQNKPVYVYTPTVVGDGFESFEQRVASRLAAKRTMSREMLAPEQVLGVEDFADLA